MATWEQLQTFSKSHNLTGPGLYVVSTLPTHEPLIKVGFSKNVLGRVKQYRKNLGGQLRILGVARVTGQLGGDGRRPVRKAERHMLDMLKDDIWGKNEWVKGESRENALNSWAMAHHEYAKDTPHGQFLYTSQDIVANLKTQPKHYEITRGGEVVQRLPLTDVGGRQYTRLRRILENPWHKDK
jgi:hypothetical protein